MKRAPFLGAAGAVLLSGCGGGHHAMQALPGVAPSNPISPNAKFSGTLVPATADPIPDSIINSPIIGEARRFDGAAAPSGWMLAQGQAIAIADNPKLFSILGHPAGDHGTTTFALPNPGFGMIVAVAGSYVTSPQMLASTRRSITSRQASLGPGAQPALHMLSPKQQVAQQKRQTALREEQQRAISAIRVGSPGPAVEPSAEANARLERATDDARTGALAALSGANRARIESLIASILGGGTTVYQASVEMSTALSSGEAQALLDAHDAMKRTAQSGWTGMNHPDLQMEAARFLVQIAFSRDQLQQLRAQNG